MLHVTAIVSSIADVAAIQEVQKTGNYTIRPTLEVLSKLFAHTQASLTVFLKMDKG